MYYVRLKMALPDGGETIIGTSVTEDVDKAVSQLLAYRECAECLVVAETIVGYDLSLGTCPTVGNLK